MVRASIQTHGNIKFPRYCGGRSGENLRYLASPDQAPQSVPFILSIVNFSLMLCAAFFEGLAGSGADIDAVSISHAPSRFITKESRRYSNSRKNEQVHCLILKTRSPLLRNQSKAATGRHGVLQPNSQVRRRKRFIRILPGYLPRLRHPVIVRRRSSLVQQKPAKASRVPLHRCSSHSPLT